MSACIGNKCSDISIPKNIYTNRVFNMNSSNELRYCKHMIYLWKNNLLDDYDNKIDHLNYDNWTKRNLNKIAYT